MIKPPAVALDQPRCELAAIVDEVVTAPCGSSNLMPYLKAILLALSLGIDVFAVSIGIGIRQSELSTRLRFAAAFVISEISMTVLGSAIGGFVYRLIGGIAGYLGFVALIGIGCFVLFETLKSERQHLDLSRGFGLFLSALAVSFDSLGIGFSIFFIGVPFKVTLIAIAVSTILATLLGFALGKNLGAKFEARAELLAGALLILTGAFFIAAKALSHGD